jgi:hypothetical protein
MSLFPVEEIPKGTRKARGGPESRSVRLDFRRVRIWRDDAIRREVPTHAAADERRNSPTPSGSPGTGKTTQALPAPAVTIRQCLDPGIGSPQQAMQYARKSRSQHVKNLTIVSTIALTLQPKNMGCTDDNRGDSARGWTTGIFSPAIVDQEGDFPVFSSRTQFFHFSSSGFDRSRSSTFGNAPRSRWPALGPSGCSLTLI